MTGDRKQPTAYSLQLRARSGFTLIEMLIAVSLFTIVVAATTDLYIVASRTTRSVRARERLGNEARFALELISREVRAGTIDYAVYGGPVPGVADFLYLIDRDGNAESFRVSASPDECIGGSHPCLLVCDATSSCSPLTTKNIFWDQIDFRISPGQDPFSFDPVSGTYASNEQPHVTVVIKLRTESNLPEERATLQSQATITSRIYKR